MDETKTQPASVFHFVIIRQVKLFFAENLKSLLLLYIIIRPNNCVAHTLL